MFIDLLGFGLVLPLLPRYGREFLDPLFPGEENHILRGTILGLLAISFSLMQFIFAPIWGRISDQRGRRPFLLLGLVGSVVFYALFGLASQMPPGKEALGLGLMFLSRAGAGIAGATVSTAQAVIADTTTPERRSRGMALIGAAFGIGFTFGPVMGAASIKFFPEYRGGPGFAAAGFSLLALFLAIFLMPETLRPERPQTRRGWLNWASIRTALRTPTVGTLVLTFFLSTLAFASFEPTLALLTQDLLGYTEDENFLVFAYVGFVLMLTQGGLYQYLARRGVPEITFMAIGAVAMAAGLGSLGVVSALAHGENSSYGLRLSGLLTGSTIAVIGFAFMTPSVQALISRRSDPTRQGEVLGVNQSVNAMSRILGPLLGLVLYNITPAHIWPYVTAAVLLTAALLLTIRARRA
jgi:MFS family permease